MTTSAAPSSKHSHEHGVDTSTITFDPVIPTGATVILGKGDHRAMLTATGTIDRLRAEDIHARHARAHPTPARRLDGHPTAPAQRPAGTLRGGASRWRDELVRYQLGSRSALGGYRCNCSRRPTCSCPTNARRRSSRASSIRSRRPRLGRTGRGRRSVADGRATDHRREAGC